MKRLIAALLMAVMMMTAACAESLTNEWYTDVPTAMTQDSVVELLANEDCQIETLQPDEESIALLDDVYRFVWEEENRPARYYDEETQRKIEEIAGGLDHLHMTEAMRLQLNGTPLNPVTAVMRLDVEYHVGQLIVVVMGIPQGEGEYKWYPYRGRVETLAEIRWDIPVEDWEALSQQPVSFHVLTDRIGPRGGRLWGMEPFSEKTPPVFSKDSGDVNGVRYWYSEWGEPIADDFRVWLVELTQPMEDEVLRIGEHLAEEKLILDYFPVERKDEALLMLPETVDPAKLVAYDIVALRDENYKDTYGDVNVEIEFGTAYHPEKATVILAGFPIENAVEAPFVEWFVLRSVVVEPAPEEETSHKLEVGLKQLNLPRMEDEPMMLIVISEELEY